MLKLSISSNRRTVGLQCRLILTVFHKEENILSEVWKETCYHRPSLGSLYNNNVTKATTYRFEKPIKRILRAKCSKLKKKNKRNKSRGIKYKKFITPSSQNVKLRMINRGKSIYLHKRQKIIDSCIYKLLKR